MDKELKEKFFSEVDSELYEADGADYIAQRCLEIAKEYAGTLTSPLEKRIKELEEENKLDKVKEANLPGELFEKYKALAIKEKMDSVTFSRILDMFSPYLQHKKSDASEDIESELVSQLQFFAIEYQHMDIIETLNKWKNKFNLK